jgi:predicted alpha/beta superfamily hydrolase
LNHKKLFNAYAAIDPSMWWDGQQLLNKSKSILADGKFDNLSLFLAIANTRELDMADVAAIRKDGGKKTELILPTVTLTEYLEANKQNKLRFSWKYYKDKHHMSVYSIAAADALDFLLKSL